MAKMIKCPTCTMQIEVPPPPAGGGPQIIKCPGCGKGLKIVVKKPVSPGGGVPSPGGSLAGGSMGGGSIAAMTFHGEPPPTDDLPNLDSVCAVCGTPTDAEALIEDNGKLLCRDCIKGARSKIARPDVSPGMINFKEPVAANVRRSKPINVTPSFVVGVLAAAIFIACQVYLTLWEAPKGKGRAIASTVTPANPVTPAPATPGTANSPTTEKPTESSANTTPPSPAPGAAVVPQTPTVTPVPAPAPGPDAVPPTPAPPVAPAPAPVPADHTIFTTRPATGDNGTQPAPAETTSPPPEPPNTAVALAPSVAPGPAIVSTSNDPLVQGIDKLQKGDYVAAKDLLQKARNKYVVGKMGDRLTPEQQIALVGVAAANIGAGTPQLAKPQLDIVLGTPTMTGKGTHSRSAVLNNAITLLVIKNPKLREMGEAIKMVHEYLAAAHDDEYAANLFGTLLDHASAAPAIPPAERTALDQQWTFLDNYNDQMAKEHPDQLKWGVEWKPRELVERYRLARNRTTPAPPAPAQLQQEHDAAKAKVYQLQQAVDKAKANHGDVFGAQNQYRDALANLKDLELRMEQAGGPVPKPKWLDKVEPVVPEGTVTTQ